MTIDELMKVAAEMGASDIHIQAGSSPILRIDGSLCFLNMDRLTSHETEAMVRSLMDGERFAELEREGELDFSYSCKDVGRFRVNAFRQRGVYCLAMRFINYDIPSLKDLGIPTQIESLMKLKRGLILVTGPTGSGKSTTLASLIQIVNRTRKCNIVTLEDPIEYLHKNDKSVISQREVGNDTRSFAKGLRAALRQDPDIILVGEMRDMETISIALNAAETGHLVLSTLHTLGAVRAIDRMIDVFPQNEKDYVKVQIAAVLEAVISQQLILKKSGVGRVPACEIMISNAGIRNQIREGKTHQIMSSIQTGKAQGMVSMDDSIKELYQRGVISKEKALSYAMDRKNMIKLIE